MAVCVRSDFLDAEIAALDGEIARAALAWPEVLRLMTVPGVNVQTAATFMAAIGDIRRFPSPRKLVSYVGLDPRVRQSGSTPARHGRISKAGASEVRHMLGEVAWKVTLTPGPLRAFFERVRARRGAQIAATATARKLAVLCWHLLRRGEDDAFARPAMTRHKGARIQQALEGQSRAADSVSPNGLRFARSVTRTRRKDLTRRGSRPLDFHPSVITRRRAISRLPGVRASAWAGSGCCSVPRPRPRGPSSSGADGSGCLPPGACWGPAPGRL